MHLIVCDVFLGGRGAAQFFSFSFRFHIQGTLTTDPWPRANPLDASYKFGELLPMQLGQIPYKKTERSSVGHCYPGGIPFNGLYGGLRSKGVTFTLQVYERVGISRVEVYERVGKSLI